MANTNASTYMSLPIPNVGVDPGPDYGVNLNSCLTILDQHNHTAGQGVAIPPSGININTDLPFGSNNATLLRSVRLAPYATIGAFNATGSDIGCLLEVGVDLYYIDGNGNQVRITQSGGVAGSPGSIAGLASPASATYVSANQTFVWQSAALTPANLDAGAVIFRNISASSKGITVSAPAGLGSNYGITWPALPGSQSFMTIDASGNMAAPIAYANGITRSNLAAVGQQVSSSCSIFSSTNAAGYDAVTNLTVTITTTGRPVMLMLIPDGGSNLASVGMENLLSAAGEGTMRGAFFRGATNLGPQWFAGYEPAGATDTAGPVSAWNMLDVVASGTYTYTFKIGFVAANWQGIVQYAKLVAYEL